MKSAHWAPEEQTMCWSGSDAATCVGECRSHWWEAVTAPGGGFFPGEGGMGVSGRPGLTADPAVACRVVVPASVSPWGHKISFFNSRYLLPCNGLKGSWGFYREEKTSPVSVHFTGCTDLNHSRAQWWFCGGHPFITKCFSIPGVPLITLC